MKTKSRKLEEVKKRTGKKPNRKRRSEELPFIYIDIETSYSPGDKPFIGQIVILNDKEEIIVNEYFEDAREITAEQSNIILGYLYTCYSVWCDPTQDLRVIRSDVRRCGLKLKTSRLRTIDIQLVENQILKKTPQHRLSLIKLARKYEVRPPVKFHDPFSDATVIKKVFNLQLAKLNIDKEHIHLLDQLP